MATAHRIRDKHLTCSICFEFYTCPKTLPCMHSFCEHCLENHIESKKDEKGFGCPICNTFTNIPDPKAPRHQWASQFRTDFKLTGMLEELQLIEQESKLSRDISQLHKVIDSLHDNERNLLEKIDEDKQSLANIGQEQEEINQQITDIFSTIRLKLQRKEESVKQRLNQTSVQRKDTVSRSWLSKQKLIDQVTSLIEEAERIQTLKGTDDTGSVMKKFHDSYTQLNAGVAGVKSVSLQRLELNMKQEDIVKFDSLAFCDLKRERTGGDVSTARSRKDPVPVSSPAKSEEKKRPAPPPPTVPSAEPGVSPATRAVSPPTTGGPPTTRPPTTRTLATPSPASGDSRKPHLVAVLTPSKAEQDKEPDLQDVIVLRDGQTQIVVVSDYNNKKVIVLYVQQGTKTQKSMKIDANPARLCKLDSSRIGISCCDPYKILIVSVFPELKQLGTIKSTLNNIGITTLNPSTLAVSSKNKVNVITTAGSVLKEFKVKTDSSYYAMSWYMVTTPTGSIIVSDRYGEMVSCVTPTGQTLWQWKTPDSTPPAGVACDQQGRIYVALTGKKEVHRLSETGQFLGVVLTKDEDLDLPTAIEIDQFGQWYVLKRSRQIQVFKH